MMNSNPSSRYPLPSVSDSHPLHCGYITLVGRPNVGKSTLFNTLLGQRLSIVTAKPQTTRDRILGILTRPDSQLIFLDTPGLLEPQYKLHESMEHQIQTAARHADVVLLLIDATRPRDRMQLVRGFIDTNTRPLVAVLNKIDQVDSSRVAGLLHLLSTELGLQSMLPVSALRGDNLDELLSRLITQVPKGPKLYPDDMIAEQPERFFVAELIREAAFNNLENELPYALGVTVEEFREGTDKTYIAAILHVERQSQKGIVIGRAGARLRTIGTQARREIEAMLAQPVYLDLWVKVRRDWRRRQRDLKEFGYN